MSRFIPGLQFQPELSLVIAVCSPALTHRVPVAERSLPLPLALLTVTR